MSRGVSARSRWSAGAGGLAALVLLAGFHGGGSGRGPILEGEAIVTLRGSGAAPFGIGAAFLGGTSFAYNLGRLQKLLEPLDILPADQSYGGALHFTLVPAGKNRWHLDELTLDYDFVNRTRFAEDDFEIADSMNDAGWVSWSDGRWNGPAGWDPEDPPRIELELFRRPEARQCEDPPPPRLVRRVREIATDTSDWAHCYRLEILVLHPARPTGESYWKTAIGEIRVDAHDGALEWSGENLFYEQMMEMWEQLPDPLGLKKMGQPMVELGRTMEELLGGGLPKLEAGQGGDWSIEGSYQGVLSPAGVKVDEIHRILTGAMLRQRIRVEFAEFALEKTPARWRPVAEAAAGSRPTVEIRARSMGSDPQRIRWRFTLFDVSREKGRYLNDTNSDTELDLVVRGEENPDWKEPEETGDGFRIETSEAVEEAVLTVRAEDYGAWGRLKAEVEIEPDRWEPVPVLGSSEESITVPRDEARGKANFIADTWERRRGMTPGLAPTLDDERRPAPTLPGDGLALYEEYRGFSVDGRWTDLDPKKKDLFIHFAPGSTYARYSEQIERASGLVVRKIRADEFVNPGVREVNANRGAHSAAWQHGLYVSDWFHSPEDPETLPADASGIAHGGPGTPADVWLIALLTNDSNPGKLLTHEVLHGMDVYHHGSRDTKRDLCWRRDSIAWFVIPKADCEALPDGEWDEGISVARRAGQHSGDQMCAMTYRTASGYTDEEDRLVVQEPGRQLEIFDRPEYASPSFNLCTALLGTRSNANGKQAADSANDRGACLNRIRVSDF